MATLRQSEHRLAAIFAGAAAGLSEISLEGGLERVNDEFCRIVGRPRATLLGTSLLAIAHADDAVVILRAVAQAVQTHDRVVIDHRYVQSDGQPIWVNTLLTRIDDPTGKPRAIVVVTVDLTPQREIQRALVESEAKFRTLAEASPGIIWLVDPTGALRYVNQRYLEFFGTTEEEVFARPWHLPVHPDDAVDHAAELNNALRTPHPLLSRCRCRRYDGQWRWIESQAAPHFGDDGRYLGHVGHSLDITDLLDATQGFRRSEERMRHVIEIETVGIVFFNLNGGLITQTNSAFLQMSGYTVEDIDRGSLRLETLTPPEYRAKTTQALDELVSLGRTFPYEKEYLRKDGTRRWGLFAATRLSPREGVKFVVDISERKQGEEELVGYRDELEERVRIRTAELDAANGALRDEILERERGQQAHHALLQQLVSAQEDERRRISRELHDQVGQDLTALMLGLKALERSADPPSRTELHRLQALTQGVGKQIHDMALELRPTALDDLGLVRTLSNYVDDWSKRVGIEVDFHSGGWQGERLPSYVETTLYRIIREALNNVAKHAAASRVSLIIERRGDQVVAIIEDNGKGFDSDRTQSRNPHRLGLLGMRERAALAQGEVSIESSLGGGTTVFVRLPLQPPANKTSHG